MAEDNLWNSIVAEVLTHTSTARRLPSKQIIVLGDEGSGKSTVVARLQDRKQAAEDVAANSGLEFTYLDVKDEESEDVISRMGVYTLSGGEDHAILLDQVLKADTLDSTVAVVVVDITRPWGALAAVQRWCGVLEAKVNGLDANDKLAECRTRLLRAFQSFTEETPDPKDKGTDDEPVLLDLEDGVLATNIGLPLVVVAAKVDAIGVLASNYDYRQEHLDFIQFHLRKLCLHYGAGLVHFGKDGKTKDALYRYLIHLGYGLPLSAKGNVSETDSVFVPSGWDNSSKIEVLTQGMQNVDASDTFEHVIRAPVVIASVHAREVEAENEHEFLAKQQPLLGKVSGTATATAGAPAQSTGAGGTAASTTEMRRSTLTGRPAVGGASAAAGSSAPTPTTPTAAEGRAVSPSPRARGVSITAPTAPGAAVAAASATARLTAPAPGAAAAVKSGAAAPQNADVLASFFNSLLQKKPATTAAAPSAADQAN